MKWEKINTDKKIVEDDLINNVLLYNGCSKSVLKDLENIKINLEFENNKIKDFADIIENLKKTQELILVIADYDSDGDTSGAIMYRFLKREGLNVDIVCLDRLVGFGMFSGTIDAIKEKYENVKCLVTTDNGSKSSSVIDYARKVLGNELKVIITDHHDKDMMIEKKADIFINPHYDTSITNERICGAFTVFVIINQYYKIKGVKKENALFLSEMLELASIATYTDVMPVFKENRTALKFLVSRVRQNKIMNKGLNALFSVIDLDYKNFTATDIGFKIGPILNASGRLASSEVPTRLLIEENYDVCLELANKCVNTNKRRQQMTKNLLSQVNIIENSNVNIVKYENAHEGLIGIIAGNVLEKTNAPSFAFTRVTNGTYKGSGRSPKNYNLIKGASRIFKEHSEIVLAFGGHPGAIGLTLKDSESVDAFEKYLNADFLENNKLVDEVSKKYVDFPTNLNIEEVFTKLETLEPYGEGLKEVVFRIVGNVSYPKIMAIRHMSFMLKTDLVAGSMKMNWFNHVEELSNFIGKKEVFFNLTKNIFRGKVYFNGNVIEARNI